MFCCPGRTYFGIVFLARGGVDFWEIAGNETIKNQLRNEQRLG
jgi:hypothetical protein